MLGMANSTGCSSVWGSTYPYNPYPFPWVNHLFQDSPSVAIGLFEAHMRKMADSFIAVRRAEKIADGSYDHVADEKYFKTFTWHEFTDEEFFLCPPIISMGGDGAMLDIGFQNLSRLLASGKPIRVVVLDTQVYSNTGGQACTSGYTGQVADMSAFGKAQHGKTETRKELGLLGIAHRTTFVHQSSQAAATHLIAGVLKGMHKRRPVLFNIYTPCPVEHGLADDWSQEAARFALESRAFPFLTYDPDGGPSFADCLSLEGNPSPESDWPTYELKYLDDAGNEQVMEISLTVADWAATEARFKQHFSPLAKDLYEYAIPFDQYLKLSTEEREHKTAFIYAVDKKRHLKRLKVSPEMALLADERLHHWHQLRELAGIVVSDVARNTVSGEIEAEFEAKFNTLKAEYEAKIVQLKKEFPQQIARRLAEGLMRHSGAGALNELLATLPAVEPSGGNGATSLAVAAPAATAAAAAPAATATATAVMEAPAAAPAAAEEEESMAIEAYIDSARCTTCNECTNLNKKMFAYNAAKQAEVKNPSAGTFQQLVLAAERCPVTIIHPGTPLNPKEKDLEKWVKRAARFN
jgi:pyruvate-ferredoxin/flavodoxin oxidoreductase